MARYFVTQSAQPTGEHEVHVHGCPVSPTRDKLVALGEHLSCISAVEKARRYYPKVYGCRFCVPACHATSAPRAP